MKTCVIIPAFNESKEISGLVEKIKAINPHILVVDDGSDDSTAQIALSAGAVVLKNSSNEGKGLCLRKGFKYALENNFDAVITMDGDGQHLPEDLPNFLRLGDDPNADIVVGNRMLKTQDMPFIRVVTNRFMSWLISLLSKQKIPDTQCGYRLIKRRVLEKLELKTSNFEIETEILINASRMGFKIRSVPIKTVYRGEKSQINPLVDTIRFLKFILRQSQGTRQ
ncbi:MAG: glycosyltransferase family 2 protein [Candidatus Omnitrophota bacterium]|nr:glycosyltransferase family 2 protein [Candidatus Omnitrophota bacterium]